MANFWGGCTPPRHSGTWVGARVASLRCHYPPPRRSQYSRNAEDRPHQSKTSCRGGHRRGTTTSGPGRGPLAGFAVTFYGRFSGDRRGFSDIISRYGCPHYLKIDVEGADMLCVDALTSLDCRPKFISIESTKTSWLGLLNEFKTLDKLGYTKFKVVDQRRHKSGQFRNTLGQPISFAFEKGASGAFGEDLEGKWLTKTQAILRYVPIFLLYKTIGHDTYLSRILRRIPKGRRVLRVVGWYDTHAMRITCCR